MIPGIVSQQALLNAGGEPAAPEYPHVFELVNPGAETGDSTGWTQRKSSLPIARTGVAHTGTYGFHSGNAGSTWWTQDVVIPSSHHEDVDAGRVGFNLTAWHAGWTDSDKGALSLDCYDGSDVFLAHYQNPLTDPPGDTVFTQDALTGPLPAGTRKLRLGTRNERGGGTELSAYWDDFAIELYRLSRPVIDIWKGSNVSTVGWTVVSGELYTQTGTYGDPVYGFSTGPGHAYRDFDISAYATDIDAGTVSMLFNTLKDRFNSGDTCRLYVEFYNGSSVKQGNTLYSDPVETTAPTGGQAISMTANVPATTRSIRLGFTGTASDGTAIQYPASNINLHLLMEPDVLPAALSPNYKHQNMVLSNYNRTVTSSVEGYKVAGIIDAKNSGKWYFEATIVDFGTADNEVGVAIGTYKTALNSYPGGGANALDYLWDGRILYGNAGSGSGPGSFVEGDVIGVEVDADTRTVKFRKNGGAWTTRTQLSGGVDPLMPLIYIYRVGGKVTINTGQEPWHTEPESGYVGWTTNPAPEPSRYWRYWTDNAVVTAGLAHITEFELRAISGGPSVATGGTASADQFHDGSTVPANAFDGNTATYWGTTWNSDAPHWLQYDFGAGNEKFITEASMRTRSDTTEGQPGSVRILRSNDGTVFFPAWGLGSPAWTPGTPVVATLY